MSDPTSSPKRGHRIVVAVATLVGVLVAGGTAAALVLSRSQGQPPNSLCKIASNADYAIRVDGILSEYDAAMRANPRFDAGVQVGDVAEYGFTPLFQMQACSIDESDVPHIHDGLQQVVYDPGIHGQAWWGTPIDIEAAWYAELGAEGLIGGWSTIARLDHDGVREIQRLLSLGLAHVTNPDRDAVLEAGVYPDFLIDKGRYLGFYFRYALNHLGGQSVELARYKPMRWTSSHRDTYLFDHPDDWELVDTGPRVYGWSVLAPLLRFGDFHEQFLTPVATAIIEFDQQRNGDWTIEGEQPVSFDAFNDDPTSAMDPVLEALNRNPAAASAVYEATGDQRVQALGDG